MFRGFIALALLATAGLALPALAADAPARGTYCATPEFHQLDFWIGDWDTVDMSDHPDGKGPSIARAHIEPILGGCALHELYEQTDGLVGQSYSLYVASRKIWHQTWVNNGGGLWLQEGTFDKDGMLTLTATTLSKDGTEVHHKITWAKYGDGVRETSVASQDGGKTWAAEFDCLFVKHKN